MLWYHISQQPKSCVRGHDVVCHSRSQQCRGSVSPPTLTRLNSSTAHHPLRNHTVTNCQLCWRHTHRNVLVWTVSYLLTFSKGCQSRLLDEKSVLMLHNMLVLFALQALFMSGVCDLWISHTPPTLQDCSAQGKPQHTWRWLTIHAHSSTVLTSA